MTKYLDYGFKDRVAIVTGAGTGVGKACAVELARGGAKVVLFGRRQGPIDEAVQECLEFTDNAIGMSVDVSAENVVKDSVSKVIEQFGKVDILINNAGVESHLNPGQSFNDLFEIQTPDEYLKFFEIHSLGHYLMNLAVMPSMKENMFGRICNITSVVGLNGAYSSPAYTASKAAANCQTKAFATQFGKYNVTVNAVLPGMVDTPMKKDSTQEEFDFVASATPLGRVADPIDIARVALFFVQENQFVSGQLLVASGASYV